MKEKYKYLPFFILSLIFVFYSLANYIVIKQDTSPLLYDSAEFLNYGLRLYRNLTSNVDGNKIQALLRFWYSGTWHKAPLVIIFTIPFYLLFGPTQDAAQLSNAFFLAILIFSVYLIGKRFQDRITGLVAAFLLLTFPIIMGQSRIYWLDFPLTCWVAFSICLLLYSDHFKNKLFSVLFGLSLGVGSLIKQTLPVFILGPVIFFIICRRPYEEKAKRIQNILFAVGIAAIIVLSWYLPNLKMKLTYFLMVPIDTALNTPAEAGFFSLAIDRLIFHLKVLRTIMLHQVYFYIFILCLISFVLHGKKDKLVLLFWLTVPYLFFALAGVPKSARYTMPVLPAIALIISCSIAEMRKGYLRRCTYAIVIFLGVFQAVYLHLVPTRYNEFSYYLSSFDKEGLIKPDNRDWKAEKIISVILKSSNGHHIRVALLPDIAPVSTGLIHHSIFDNTGIEIILPTLVPPFDYYDRMDLYRELILKQEFIIKFDYIILASEDDGALEFWRMQPEIEVEIYRDLKKNFKKSIQAFNLLEKINLPYGLEVSIYKNTGRVKHL